jgi:hypothetical protein
MSILQEYEYIRKYVVGEKTYKKIEEYLEIYPDVLLSDIYYNMEAYKKFESWLVKQGG